MQYTHSSHSVYLLTYHFIFVVKYRRKVITDEIGDVRPGQFIPGRLKSHGVFLPFYDKFLDQHATELDTLIIHCNFGACRSAAIAAAIMKAITGDDKMVFDCDGLVPNMHCYRLTLNELLDENGNNKLNSGINCEFISRKW